MRTIRDEFNSHYYGIKSQFDNTTPLVNSLAGYGTAGVVSFVGSITGLVLAGVGMVGTAATVGSFVGLAAFGITVATLVTGGRVVPTMTAGALGGIATPFTAAAKGIKSVFQGKTTAPKQNPDRPRPY